MTSSGDVFAGASNGDVQRFHDGGWAWIPSPLADVRALWAVDAGEVYAGGVGAVGASAALWSGGTWGGVGTPGLKEINALLGTSSGLMAGADHCQFAQLSGGFFESFASLSACDAGIHALAGTSLDDLIGAGAGFILLADAGFLFSVSDDQPDAGVWLAAATPPAGQPTLAGENGIIAHADAVNGRMTIESRGTGQGDVFSVAVADGGFLFAGSGGGSILARTVVNRAGAWSPLTATLASDNVLGLWAGDPANLWGVTDQGNVGQLTLGAAVSLAQAPAPLFAVMHHGSNLFFGGVDGGMYRLPDGQALQDFVHTASASNTAHSTMRALASDGTLLYVATGDGVLLATNDGSGWPGDLPLGENLSCVSAVPGFIITAGADGGVWAGTDTMNMQFSPTGSHDDFNGAFATSSTNAWLVGDHGSTFNWNGSSWQHVAAPTAVDLLAVTGSDQGSSPSAAEGRCCTGHSHLH